MVSKGNKSISIEDIVNKVSEAQLLSYYFNISSVPILINSPLRQDRKPSFGIYSPDGKRISYKDFATGDSGSLFDLLGKIWNVSFQEVLSKIYNDIVTIHKTPCPEITIINFREKTSKSFSTLQCKIRDWKDYDIQYWKSYGVPLKWLQYADIYPISYTIIYKGKQKYSFVADKYAYAFVEKKEGNITLKIYQPFNKEGFKWTNKHDSSVISLWTKLPETGDKVVICSSVKDALCLWSNIGIPSVALQGEGYSISKTAANELKKRFKHIYILFDNDEPGILDSKKLSEKTGFTNIILPQGYGKDISDIYKTLNNKILFKQLITKLFI